MSTNQQDEAKPGVSPELADYQDHLMSTFIA